MSTNPKHGGMQWEDEAEALVEGLSCLPAGLIGSLMTTATD
jgi:hypothetical protein